MLSIAVLHHLSTPKRRIQAIAELLRVLKPVDGRLVIFVWALEQTQSRRKVDPNQPDVLVPWHTMKTEQGEEYVYKRYYHLFGKEELEALVEQVNEQSLIGKYKVAVERKGYDRDNWFVILKKYI